MENISDLRVDFSSLLSPLLHHAVSSLSHVGRHAGKRIRIVVLVSGESATSIIQNMIVPHRMVFQRLSRSWYSPIANVPSKRPVENFHSADSFACPAHRMAWLDYFRFKVPNAVFINDGRTCVDCAESILWSVICNTLSSLG